MFWLDLSHLGEGVTGDESHTYLIEAKAIWQFDDFQGEP
jgi:hypothetical protein